MPLRAAALLLIVLLAGACTGERPTLAGTVDVTSTTTLGDDDPNTTVVAEANSATVDIYSSRGADVPALSLSASNEVSGRLIFVVRSQEGDWLEVLLPVRANGPSGWVRRADVGLTRHDYRIEVMLAEHRLRVFQGAATVMNEPIAVGTTDAPEPGGELYVKELLRPPDPDGPYGTYAYGFSGNSNVLNDFALGDGVIGIHGTNDPDSIGSDVDHGCIRLSNDAINRLVDDVGLPLGTPVEIRP